MTITATNYLFKGTTYTATTTATASPTTTAKFQNLAMTISNTATTNLTTYVDVQFYDGTSTYTVLQKAPLYPGGNVVVEGFAKHVLPSGGATYVTPYSTFVASALSGVEIQ